MPTSNKLSKIKNIIKQVSSSYPDYNRSLITQNIENPTLAGMARGAKAFAVGSIIGSFIARLFSNKPKHVLTGALLSGALSALPGYWSGRNEAKSRYSRLLFLRRRLGINEPGEYETLLKHPELIWALYEQELSNKKLNTKDKENDDLNSNIRKTASASKLVLNPAVKAEIIKRVIGALVGGTVGSLWGYKLSPVISGYSDVEPARRLSGITGTMTGALAGALFSGNPKDTLKFIKSHPAQALAIPSGLALGELLPSTIAALYRQPRATKDIAESITSLRDSSVSERIKQLLSTPSARGAGVGVGLAGLLSLITGLSRKRTEDEIKKNKTRSSMVASDFLKYIVPAAVGGGIVGSLDFK